MNILAKQIKFILKAGALTVLVLSACKPASPAIQTARIAFSSDRDGNSEIFSMNPDGSGLANLTNNPAEDSYPTWSPDHNRIAFLSDRTGNSEIFVMNADGSGQTQLTDLTGQIWEPSWSGDGKKIAFTKDFEIYAIKVDGSDLTNLTNNPTADYHPA